MVRAVNGAGADPTPAVYKWMSTRRRRRRSLTTRNQPAPIPAKASSSNTTRARWESLPSNAARQRGCRRRLRRLSATGKTLPKITENGNYTFKVLAIDQATNKGTPESYPFTVDTSLAETGTRSDDHGQTVRSQQQLDRHLHLCLHRGRLDLCLQYWTLRNSLPAVRPESPTRPDRRAAYLPGQSHRHERTPGTRPASPSGSSSLKRRRKSSRPTPSRPPGRPVAPDTTITTKPKAKSRPDADLQIQIRACPGATLRVHARRQGAEALPLAADDEIAVPRQAQLKVARHRRRPQGPDSRRQLLQGGERRVRTASSRGGRPGPRLALLGSQCPGRLRDLPRNGRP